MKAKIHDKNTLDTIGRRLIERDVTPAEEIERIVSNPYLFARINARITETSASKRSPLFVRYTIAGAGMLVVAIAFTAAVVSLRSATEVSHVIEVQAPAEMPATARPANLPPLRAGSNPTSGRAVYREPEPEAGPERTAVKATYTTRQTPKREKDVIRDDQPAFIPVAYTGDPRETAGGHIVRVDMSRSSLFALGVNVPLENDSDTVKADLLVGADGVTRAIRVVK